MPSATSLQTLHPPRRPADEPPSSSDAASPTVHVSHPSSRTPSPYAVIDHHAESRGRPRARKKRPDDNNDYDDVDSDASDVELLEPRPGDADGRENLAGTEEPSDKIFDADDVDFDDEDDEDDDAMPSDLRPPLHRPTDGKSQTPLLPGKRDSSRHSYNSPQRPHHSRRSTFHERDPEVEAQAETRRRYTFAAFFLALSLVSFTIQTETAVYIQKNLHWEKPYCMLWLTHGSWSLLWPVQLGILRLNDMRTPWRSFWRRHVQLLRTTAQMVQHQTLHPTTRQASHSPVFHMLKVTTIVTCALTIAGGSWYIAVDLTTASDLTAIYNCSAFFAYAFSIPLLKERVRAFKLFAVVIAIVGVLIVAYGDVAAPKHGSKSGGGAGGHPATKEQNEAKDRALGNIIIGVGSVLYGFYEVLYKKVACPPDGCDPTRGTIFANTFGALIGSFTLFVLWIPLPLLHYYGLETFELPQGRTAWMLLISVLSNATFSGSFLVLISLTSPVLSSVAALLTIFIVALVDQLLPNNPPLSASAIIGGLLIVTAFGLLSWSTYREMQEEQRHKAIDEVEESDFDD